MKSLKIFFLAALVALAGVFTACTEDGNWSAGENEKGMRVYFSSENATGLTASSDATSVSIDLARNETVGALEVGVTATFEFAEDAALFTIPSTVVFADGAATAPLTIGYDYSKLTGGASYDVTFKLTDESMNSTYGYSEQTVTIVVPEPYVLLGTGLYREDLVFPLWTGKPSDFFEVEIYENLNYPGYFFLKNVYTSAFPIEMFFEAYGGQVSGSYVEEDKYFIIDARDPNKVVLPAQKLGLTLGNYGEMLVAMISDAGVGTVDDCAGTYKDGVITFPARGLYIQDSDGGYYGNPNGAFMLCMPGVELTDYAMTVAYGGMQVEADNTTVSAVLNGTYGADVASMRYAFFDGDVTGAAAQAAEMIIAAAEEEVGVMAFEQGLGEKERVFSILESTLAAPGLYTVFCVPYNAAGEPQAAETAAVSFYFPGMGGQELPECELVCGVFPFSWLYPAEYHSAYPDSSTLAAIIAGVDIASCRYGFITGLHLADLGFEGDVAGETAVAVQDFVTEALGVSSTDDWMQALGAEEIAYINSENGLDVFFDGLPAEMSCTLFVEGKNSYGKSQVYASSGATTAEGVQAEPMAQKGSVKAGQYVMKARRTPGQALKAHTLKK